jgi:hypothetical protein
MVHYFFLFLLFFFLNLFFFSYLFFFNFLGIVLQKLAEVDQSDMNGISIRSGFGSDGISKVGVRQAYTPFSQQGNFNARGIDPFGTLGTPKGKAYFFCSQPELETCGLFLGTEGKIGQLDGNASLFDSNDVTKWAQKCNNCGSYRFVKTCTDEEVSEV